MGYALSQPTTYTWAFRSVNLPTDVVSGETYYATLSAFPAAAQTFFGLPPASARAIIYADTGLTSNASGVYTLKITIPASQAVPLASLAFLISPRNVNCAWQIAPTMTTNSDGSVTIGGTITFQAFQNNAISLLGLTLLSFNSTTTVTFDLAVIKPVNASQ